MRGIAVFLSLVVRFLSLHRFVPPSHSQVQNHVWPYGSPQTNTYKIPFMFKYIYIYMCTCIHILYFTFCYIYLFPLKLTYLQICMLYRLICTYIYTYLQTCFCMHKRVYICTFYIFPANTCAYVYYNITFLHESIYVYIYIHYACDMCLSALDS